MESQTPPRTPKRFIPAGQQKPAPATAPAANTPKQPSPPKQPGPPKAPSSPKMDIPARPGLKFDPKQRMSEYKGQGLSDFEASALTYHDVHGKHAPDLHKHPSQSPSPAFLERVRGAAQKIVDHHHSQKASEGGISDLPFKATHHHIHQEIAPALEAAHGKISDLSQEMDPFERMLAIGNTVSGHIGGKLSDVGDKYRDAKIASMGNQVLLHNMISGQSGSHDASGDVSAIKDLSSGASKEDGGNVGFSVSTDPRTAKIGAISQNPEARKRSLERAAKLKGQLTEDQARESVKRLSQRKQQLLADLNLSDEEKRDFNLFMAHHAPIIEQVQRGKRGFRVEGEGKDINDYHALAHSLLRYDPSKGEHFGKYFASNLGRGVRNIVSGGSDTAGLPKKLSGQYAPKSEAVERAKADRVKPTPAAPATSAAPAPAPVKAEVPVAAPAQRSAEDIQAEIAKLQAELAGINKAPSKESQKKEKSAEEIAAEEKEAKRLAEIAKLVETQGSDEDYIPNEVEDEEESDEADVEQEDEDTSDNEDEDEDEDEEEVEEEVEEEDAPEEEEDEEGRLYRDFSRKQRGGYYDPSSE